MVVGCINAILHIDANGKEQKSIPAEGTVVDVISLNIGNIIYIGRLNGLRTVRAIDGNGRELWKYEHSELKRPWGLTKDFVENIYITGYSSNNIHMLSSTGYALKIFEQILHPSRMILRKESNDEFYVVSASTSVKRVKLIWWMDLMRSITMIFYACWSKFYRKIKIIDSKQKKFLSFLYLLVVPAHKAKSAFFHWCRSEASWRAAFQELQPELISSNKKAY